MILSFSQGYFSGITGVSTNDLNLMYRVDILVRINIVHIVFKCYRDSNILHQLKVCMDMKKLEYLYFLLHNFL